MTDGKKFCKRCGKKLVLDPRIIGYDEYTGQPVYVEPRRMACPDGYLCHRSETAEFWQLARDVFLD